jgi:hypothetical protein
MWDENSVRAYLLEHNHLLIDKSDLDIRRSKAKIILQCQEGHHFAIRWDSFLRGVRCKLCANNRMRLNEDDIRDRMDACGARFVRRLDKDVMEAVCRNGHNFKTRLADLEGGHYCLHCARDDQRLTYVELESEARSIGYTLLEQPVRFIPHTDHIQLRCKQGHEYSVLVNSWRMGHRCKTCERMAHKV